MKKCPYCAEEIQDAAIVCRYCGRDIAVPARQAAAPRSKVRIPFWLFVGASFLMMCCCGLLVSTSVGSAKATSTPEEVAAVVSNAVIKTSIPAETATPTRTEAPTTNTSEPGSTLQSTSTSQPLPTETTTPLPTATAGLTARGAACIPDNPRQTGKVVDVVDGDTIKVLSDQDGRTYTVRYIGMDTPETNTAIEYFGAEASSKNVQLVFGKDAILIKDVSETDRYGRLLRYVIVDGLFINYELVSQGYASTASYPPDIACIPDFQEAEQKARTSNLGLWNAPPPLVVIPTSSGGGGENAVCNCGGPDLDCKDFSSHAAAQACYDYCSSQGYGDPHRLDGNDNDGLACESLP